MAWAALGMVWAATVAPARAAGDAVDPRLGPMMSQWRCPIMAYLEAIRGTWINSEGWNRFLIINPKKWRARYVQCVFFEKDGAKVSCEAASGFFNEEVWDFLTPERIAIVGALGYSTDRSKDNFVWDSPDEGLEMLYDIAGLMVETLVRVFDQGVDDGFTFNAPLLRNRALTGVEGSKRCPIPIS